MRRHLIPALAVTLLVPAAGLVGTAATARAVTAACTSNAPADTNGDGFSDVPVGSPSATVGGASNAGAVTLFTGGGQGLAKSATFVQGARGVPSTASAHHGFGDVVIPADVNGDGCADLIAGSAQGTSFPKAATTVLFGSPGSGVTSEAAQFAATTEPMTAGDYNGDGYDDLLAQVLDQGPSGPQCCAYDVIPGSASGLNFGGGTPLTVPDPLFAYGVAVSGDVNGDGDADIAVYSAANSEIQVVYGSATGPGGGLPTQLWSRETPGIPGDDVGSARFPMRFGDFNDDGFDDLAFGEFNGAQETDHVTVIYGSAAGLTAAGAQDWAKTTPGVAGHRHAGDQVGHFLAAADLNGDGSDELAISATPDTLLLPGTSATGLTAPGSKLWTGTTGEMTAGSYGKGAPDDLLVATGGPSCVVAYGSASAASGVVPKHAVTIKPGKGKACEIVPQG